MSRWCTQLRAYTGVGPLPMTVRAPMTIQTWGSEPSSAMSCDYPGLDRREHENAAHDPMLCRCFAGRPDHSCGRASGCISDIALPLFNNQTIVAQPVVRECPLTFAASVFPNPGMPPPIHPTFFVCMAQPTFGEAPCN